jgi:hypothetical protein
VVGERGQLRLDRLLDQFARSASNDIGQRVRRFPDGTGVGAPDCLAVRKIADWSAYCNAFGANAREEIAVDLSSQGQGLRQSDAGAGFEQPVIGAVEKRALGRE